MPVAGIVGHAVRTGQHVNVLDAQSDDRLAEEVRAWERGLARSSACLRLAELDFPAGAGGRDFEAF